ncbi:MAG: RNA polymerase sigma factor [Cyclobacteriaceae bacterium]
MVEKFTKIQTNHQKEDSKSAKIQREFAISEIELWKNFKAGDESAFVRIYENYFDILVSYCFQFTKNEDLIKDCVQDLFIYLRDKRALLGDTTYIKLYLIKACRRRIVDELSKNQKSQKAQAESLYFITEEVSLEDHMINGENIVDQKQKLSKAIESLSNREREVIYYYYYQNFSFAQITEILNYNEVKTVRSLLYKSLKRLKSVLQFLAIFLLTVLFC